jgi:hypothetical protein
VTPRVRLVQQSETDRIRRLEAEIGTFRYARKTIEAAYTAAEKAAKAVLG